MLTLAKRKSSSHGLEINIHALQAPPHPASCPHHCSHAEKTPPFLSFLYNPFPVLSFSSPSFPFFLCTEVTLVQVQCSHSRLSSKQILSISPPAFLFMLWAGQSGVIPFLLLDGSLCQQAKECCALQSKCKRNIILSVSRKRTYPSSLISICISHLWIES